MKKWVVCILAGLCGCMAVQSTAPGREEAETSRQMVFKKKYLNLPVKNGARKRIMKVIVDGRVYMPIGTILPEDNRTLELFSKDGSTGIDLLELYELRPAWK